MSTMAKRNGAVGCVCDSQIRDCVWISEMGFPVYYAGIRPLDSQGRARVIAYDVPVRCGDVLVHPGDLVFTDFDGVVNVWCFVGWRCSRGAQYGYSGHGKETLGWVTRTSRELTAGGR